MHKDQSLTWHWINSLKKYRHSDLRHGLQNKDINGPHFPPWHGQWYTYIHTYLYYSQRKIQTPRKKAKHLEDTLANVTLSNKARLVSTTRYFEIPLSYYQRLQLLTAMKTTLSITSFLKLYHYYNWGINSHSSTKISAPINWLAISLFLTCQYHRMYVYTSTKSVCVW